MSLTIGIIVGVAHLFLNLGSLLVRADITGQYVVIISEVLSLTGPTSTPGGSSPWRNTKLPSDHPAASSNISIACLSTTLFSPAGVK